jgi:hypothetical protein
VVSPKKDSNVLLVADGYHVDQMSLKQDACQKQEKALDCALVNQKQEDKMGDNCCTKCGAKMNNLPSNLPKNLELRCKDCLGNISTNYNIFKHQKPPYIQDKLYTINITKIA